MERKGWERERERERENKLENRSIEAKGGKVRIDIVSGYMSSSIYHD